MTILTDNFAVDTGQITSYVPNVTSGGSPWESGGTVAISGGQLVFTAPASSSVGVIGGNTAAENAWTIASPSLLVTMDVGTPTWQLPAPSGQVNFGCGIVKDASNCLMATVGPETSSTTLSVFVYGIIASVTFGVSAVIPITALPDAVGFGLENNIVTCYLLFGGSWQQVTSIGTGGNVDVSAQYDFTAPGALAGWNPGFIFAQDNNNVVTTIAAAQIQYTAPFVSPVTVNATVPDLTNTSVAIVVPGLLAAADLVLGTITYATSGTVIAGNVISQTPAPGTVVLAGSAVNVVVSTGLPALTVPDLFGLTQSEAVILLLSLGLVPGAVGSAPSKFVPPGLVQTQNPSAGAPVAVGTIVSFVLSLGTPAVGVMFDFEATVISQYANSPTIMQLCNNLNQYIDQSANFANFFNYVWNVDTAVGFGLDIWGKIVGVSRLLQIPNTTPYVGFYISSESQPDQDWTPAGSDQDNPPVGGAFYTGHNATEAYLLDDASYRQLILAKAFANICTTTAPAINQILQNLYGPGNAWVLNTGPMSISYNLSFTPTPIQLAILEQSGVIPTPPGVSVVINTNV